MKIFFFSRCVVVAWTNMKINTTFCSNTCFKCSLVSIRLINEENRREMCVCFHLDFKLPKKRSKNEGKARRWERNEIVKRTYERKMFVFIGINQANSKNLKVENLFFSNIFQAIRRCENHPFHSNLFVKSKEFERFASSYMSKTKVLESLFNDHIRWAHEGKCRLPIKLLNGSWQFFCSFFSFL